MFLSPSFYSETFHFAPEQTQSNCDDLGGIIDCGFDRRTSSTRRCIVGSDCILS